MLYFVATNSLSCRMCFYIHIIIIELTILTFDLRQKAFIFRTESKLPPEKCRKLLYRVTNYKKNYPMNSPVVHQNDFHRALQIIVKYLLWY